MIYTRVSKIFYFNFTYFTKKVKVHSINIIFCHVIKSDLIKKEAAHFEMDSLLLMMLLEQLHALIKQGWIGQETEHHACHRSGGQQ